MLRSGFLKFSLAIFLVIVLSSSIFLASCSSSSPSTKAATTAPTTSAPQPTGATTAPTSKPVTSTSASPVSGTKYEISIVVWDTSMAGWQQAVKAVLALAEQKSQGRLKFKILGGAEVIPSQEQFEAVRSGVADSVWGPTGYFIGTAPAGEAMFLDMATAKDRRASGLEDLFNQYYQTKGHYYLMMIDPSSFKEGMYGMFVNGNITKLDDLKGVKIRATGSFAPWVKAFGGVPVNIPSGEIYTAAQSGIVAGCTQPADEQFYNRALYEVIKGYIWPFVGKNPLIWSMNLNKWNALPADIQKIIKDSIIEIENDPVWVKTMYDFHVGWDAKFQAKGMKKFDFGPEAQAKVRDAFAAGIWDAVMKGDAVWGAKLKAIIDAQK